MPAVSAFWADDHPRRSCESAWARRPRAATPVTIRHSALPSCPRPSRSSLSPRRSRNQTASACLQRVEAAGWCAYLGGMARYELTDTAWQRLEPLLPPSKPRTGRPNHDHRRILNGILWIHRTGAPWRDLPERYGPVGTVSSCFSRWCRAGVWDRILSALQAEADARGEIDWDLHFVDATIARAPQHAAGARRTGAIGG